MSTFLNFGRDTQGYNAFSPETAKDKWGVNLATGVETNIIVPSNHKVWIAAFSYQPGSSVWVDLTGATAIVPSSGTLTPTTAELLPASRTILAGSKISMITSDAAAQVGISLYANSYP